VWGIGEVLASHVVMKPNECSERGLTDAMPHRSELSGLYNYYSRTQSEPAQL